METEARYALVGSVVLGLFALGIGVYFWHHFAGRGEAQAFYKVFFREQSLAGLDVNSTVTMRGIRVGSVRSYRILPDEQQGVEVLIAVPSSLPVRTTTTAVIDRNLLTGIASIDLRSAEPHNAPFVQDVQTPVYLFGDVRGYVIEEGKLPLQEITKNIEDIVKNLDDALLQVRNVFSDENQESISAILSNLESLTHGFAAKGGDLAVLQEQASELISGASELIDTVKDSFGSVVAGVNHLTASLQFGTAATLEALRSAGERVSALADEMEQPESILFGVSPKSYGPGEGGS